MVAMMCGGGGGGGHTFIFPWMLLVPIIPKPTICQQKCNKHCHL